MAKPRMIRFYIDVAYAGEGWVLEDRIVCSALLGKDDDESAETYEAILEAMDEDPKAKQGTVNCSLGSVEWRIV